MPVFEWDLDLQASEWDWREATGSLPELDIYDVEDFWRKFEELPDLGDDLESLLESAVCHNDPSNVLRHHDCMWAGMCLSKEHKNLIASGTNILPQPPPIPPPPLPAQISQEKSQPVTPKQERQQQPAVPATSTKAANSVTKTVTGHTIVNHHSPIINNNNNNNSNSNSPMDKPKREPRRKGVIVQKTVGRSLLINSRSRMPEPTRPETPPSLSESEEDDKKAVSSVVPVSEITNQVSVRTMQLQQQQQQQQQKQTTNLNVQFDHNYDKSVRLDDLGVQTPSDSEEEEDEEEEVEEEDDDDDEEEEVEDEEDEQELHNGRIVEEESDEEDSEEEEIDVVSLNNTTSSGVGSNTIRMRNSQLNNSLPYNPSRELRRELQDTVATAINTSKLFSASRSPASSRRMNNGPGRRKRKRADSDDEEDQRMLIHQLQQHQQALLNSRIQPTGGSLMGANGLSSPAYNSNSSTTSSTTTTSSSSRYHHTTHHRRTWRRQTTTQTTTTTMVTSKKSRFSTDSETDCEKRSLHNNMERMRRIGLRNAFEELRLLIPSLEESKRAAKVNILKDSAIYVRQLTAQERNLAQEVVSLHQEQEKLRTRLSKLRRSLAANR